MTGAKCNPFFILGSPVVTAHGTIFSSRHVPRMRREVVYFHFSHFGCEKNNSLYSSPAIITPKISTIFIGSPKTTPITGEFLTENTFPTTTNPTNHLCAKMTGGMCLPFFILSDLVVVATYVTIYWRRHNVLSERVVERLLFIFHNFGYEK